MWLPAAHGLQNAANERCSCTQIHDERSVKMDTTWMALDFGPLLGGDLRLWGAALTFLFVSVFDLAGVQFGIGMRAELLDDDGLVPFAGRAFGAAALGSLVGACMGTSPLIIANETMAGVVEGGRTGLQACVVGVLFILTAWWAPLLEAVPVQAAAAPLVIVGVFMMSPVRAIHWEDMFEALPAFFTITVMPFTYSIANGVLAGILTHCTLLTLVRGVEFASSAALALRADKPLKRVKSADLLTSPLLTSAHVPGTPWGATLPPSCSASEDGLPGTPSGLRRASVTAFAAPGVKVSPRLSYASPRVGNGTDEVPAFQPLLA